MPVLTMDVGKLSHEEKVELIKRLSETASEITKIPINTFTVVINEREDDSIGIGGQTIGELKRGKNAVS